MLDPRGEELVAAGVPLLHGDAVADVVLPRAVDLEVPLGNALVTDLELLDDAPAAGVAGHDADLDAVQQQLLEGELQDHDHGFGDVGIAGMSLVDPVSDRARLHRAADHVVQVDLADDLLVDEQAELVCRRRRSGRGHAAGIGRRTRRDRPPGRPGAIGRLGSHT